MTYEIRRGPYEEDPNEPFTEIEQVSPGRFLLPAGEHGRIEVTGTCEGDTISITVKY